MMLPVGTEDFKRVIDRKLDFVDKTLLIKAIFDDRANDKLVFTRPRRFGKTFNLSMLHYFLAEEVYGESTQGLFDNLNIARCGDDYMRHQGQYPVISLTLKEINAESYEEAISRLHELMSGLFIPYQYLLTSTHLTDQHKRDFEAILRKKSSEAALMLAIKNLTEYLYLHHGVRPWLLLDEYDTPIQRAYSNNYYEKMIDFMRGLMGASLKTNPYLEKAVITGILRIAKESLFSGVNNLEVYSILSKQYSEYFGFTEFEVNEILNKAKLTEKTDAIKNWYNGYQFGETIIYNPWSLAKCINERGETKPYWINTSDNQLIKNLLKAAPLRFKQEFTGLLNGNCVKELVDEKMVFHYLNNNPSSVWNLLLMAGYLKVQSSEETYQGTIANLCIPNQEIHNLYYQIIEQWLANGHGIMWYNEFIDSLLSGNIDNFNKQLENIIEQITSYHDFAKEPEAFYQGLLLGFTASLHGTKAYEIKSNRESGLGRFDIMLIPQDRTKLGIIIELKVAKENEPLLNAANNALQQIHDKKYVVEIQSRGIKQAVKIGIGFRNKDFELVYEIKK